MNNRQIVIWFCHFGQTQEPLRRRQSLATKKLSNNWNATFETKSPGTAQARFTFREPVLLCRWGGGHATTLLRHKTTVLCRKQSSELKLITYYGIKHLSWISAPALHQKLSIGWTWTKAYKWTFGMGLDPKLMARDTNMKVHRCIRTLKNEGWHTVLIDVDWP